MTADLFGSGLLPVRLDPATGAIAFGAAEQAGPPRYSREPRPDLTGGLEPIPDPAVGSWQAVESVREVARIERAFRAIISGEGVTGELEVARLDEGTVGVVVNLPGAAAIGQSFVARPGERFLGFGERSHAAVLARGVIENYVGEGPYQPHEYPFLTDTVPPWGIRNRLDATYFPVPWILSTRGYGVLIDEDGLSYERMRVDAEDVWSVEVEGSRLSYRVFAGPAPLDALRRFTAATGRQPAPERWFFGPWYQSGHSNHVPIEEERRQLAVLGDAAASAVETHCRYLPLGEDRGHEESERARTEYFHSEGKAVLSYLNPLVGRDYPEAFDPAAAAGALQRQEEGAPYVFRAYAGGRVPPHTDEAHYDFTHPDAEGCWAEVAERLMAAGYDGWMEDFGEYTPLDALGSDGSTGVAGHNRYPTDYHSAAAAVAARLEERHGRRLARFVRSGWTGTAAAVPIVWGGDPTTSWGFDGLASAVTEGLSIGASGVAVWGSDTGGFLSTLDRLTPELLCRWIQFSAFSPVMRTKAGGIEIPEYERPQIWDPEVLPVWGRWAGWHIRLNDYLMAAFDEYRESGRPIMCPLELVHPEMGPVDDNQYLFGPTLLVAPVLEPGAEHRGVAFPPGRWCNLFRPQECVDGPVRVDVQVTAEEIPVYARGGSILALLPEAVTSLSPYAPRLEDRRSVLVFGLGLDGQGRLGPDQSYTVGREGDWWTLELRAARPFTWEVTVWLDREPVEVRAEGAWSYDREAGRLDGSFTGTVQNLRLKAPADRPAGPPS